MTVADLIAALSKLDPSRRLRAYLTRRRHRRDVAGARRLLAEYGLPVEAAMVEPLMFAMALHFRDGGTITMGRDYAPVSGNPYADGPIAGRRYVHFITPNPKRDIN